MKYKFILFSPWLLKRSGSQGLKLKHLNCVKVINTLIKTWVYICMAS